MVLGGTGANIVQDGPDVVPTGANVALSGADVVPSGADVIEPKVLTLFEGAGQPTTKHARQVIRKHAV